MLEIEQKYRHIDVRRLRELLPTLGCDAPEALEEADHYFNGPDRDFALTGEAFRLRRVGQANFLTYKGPRQQAAIRIRTELEIPLPPGDEAARQHGELLVHLGFRPVAVVRKKRSIYALRREGFAVQICLDDVEGLGEFAEIEVLAEQEQADNASGTLHRLADELGLREVEPRSYLSLHLAKQAGKDAKGREPAVVRSVAELRKSLAEARRQRLTVGLVPTMGALHEGHLSLIRAARAVSDFVVVSIFVNPTQFGPSEDLGRYPRPLAEDLRLCASTAVDLVYHPPVEEMYPPGFRTYAEVTGLQDVLEGASRPGHFRGVATVVLKLLNQVAPNRAFFGQKDAQQARIIQQMVRDLDVAVDIVVVPTVREPDGLALSSRNRYLSAEQRQHATVLSRALFAAQKCYDEGQGKAAPIRQLMHDMIQATPGATLDHAAVVDPDTLAPLEDVERGALLALAVRIGDTRLIDNLRLPPRS